MQTGTSGMKWRLCLFTVMFLILLCIVTDSKHAKFTIKLTHPPADGEDWPGGSNKRQRNYLSSQHLYKTSKYYRVSKSVFSPYCLLVAAGSWMLCLYWQLLLLFLLCSSPAVSGPAASTHAPAPVYLKTGRGEFRRQAKDQENNGAIIMTPCD